MSGHSKWATTKHHKALIDAKKGKIFSVLSKELTLAARNGGKDPDSNPRLRTLLLKAKAANMPSDNVERAILKGTGELPGAEYLELVYEGYSSGGVGVILTVTTDNKNRSASEVRSTFTKHGGNLAGPGSLARFFSKQGQFIISKEKTTEDKLMELALDNGADDVKTEGDAFEVLCPIGCFDKLAQALADGGISPDESEIAYIPTGTIPVADAETARKVQSLVEALDDLEDVQNVYSNEEIPDGMEID
ncbi:MAG TPA: YebC/PmpR family DNA-binding transcriptional regulator [Opitutales bacterium]|nr:YebC/PmpR family DNA-binding transcriptional regulator [Opitutales bacterium]